MSTTKGKWIVAATCVVFPLAFALLDGRAVEEPRAEEKKWPGLYKDGKPFQWKNLRDTKAKVDFFYHGPGDKRLHLEGCVLKEGKESLTLGITVWKQDVAFSAYDNERKTLEVYLLPEHLKDPKEIRIPILPLTEFTAPAGVQSVRVVYLP